MSKNIMSMKTYFHITLTSTVILMIFRIIATLSDGDVSVNLYKPDAVLAKIFKIALVSVCVILFVMSFMVKNVDTNKKYSEKLPTKNVFAAYINTFCSFSFITCAAVQLLYFAPDMWNKTSLDTTFGTHSTSSNQFIIFLNNVKTSFLMYKDRYFIVLSVILCIICTMYFIDSVNPTRAKIRIKFEIYGPILWAMVNLINLYFDTTTSLNYPEKQYLIVSYIATMAFMSSNARYILDIPKPGRFFPLGMIAIVVIGSICIPHLLLSAFWVIGFKYYSVYAVNQVAIMIFIVYKMHRYSKI